LSKRLWLTACLRKTPKRLNVAATYQGVRVRVRVRL